MLDGNWYFRWGRGEIAGPVEVLCLRTATLRSSGGVVASPQGGATAGQCAELPVGAKEVRAARESPRAQG